jgi:hypothetical protein
LLGSLLVSPVGSALAAERASTVPTQITKISEVPGLSEVPPGTIALVVARRHKGIGGGALRFEMRLNGVTIADLGKRDFAVIYLAPGSYSLESHMYANIVQKQLVDTKHFDISVESSGIEFFDVAGRGAYMVQRTETEALEMLKGMLLTRMARYADLVGDPVKLARAQQERDVSDAAQRSAASTQFNQTLSMGGINPGSRTSASGIPVGAASGAAGGACPSTLAHLAPRLPPYNNSTLQQLRTAVLGTDMRAAMQSAQAQGFTPAQAAGEAARAASQAEENRTHAAQCIKGFAVDPEKVAGQLQDGTFVFSPGSITTDCTIAYVAAHYQAVANREAAIILACMTVEMARP